MKKIYETPSVEKISFQYREQIVASNECGWKWTNIGTATTPCSDWKPEEQVNLLFLRRNEHEEDL